MKAVLLFGSPRKKGFTRLLTDEFLSTLSTEWEIKYFDAYALNAKPCFGCGACSSAGVCLHDDLNELFSAVYECDLLVIASPVYYLSFPAPLKAIVDRLQRFHEAGRRGLSHMSEKERRCVVLLAAGSPSERGDVISRQIKWITSCLGIVQTELIVCADTDRVSVNEFLLDARRKIRKDTPEMYIL